MTRVISRSLAFWYDNKLSPLEPTAEATLAKRLRRLAIELGLDNANASYGPGPTDWIGGQLPSLSLLAQRAYDEGNDARLARLRLARLKLPDGRSYVDLLADLAAVYPLVRQESEIEGRYFIADPATIPLDAPDDQKARLLTPEEAARDRQRRTVLLVRIKTLYDETYPDKPSYMETKRPKQLDPEGRGQHIHERDHWGPLPMFTSIVLLLLREPLLKSGWSIAKAVERVKF